MPPVRGIITATSAKVSAPKIVTSPPSTQASMPMPGPPPVAW